MTVSTVPETTSKNLPPADARERAKEFVMSIQDEMYRRIREKVKGRALICFHLFPVLKMICHYLMRSNSSRRGCKQDVVRPTRSVP